MASGDILSLQEAARHTPYTPQYLGLRARQGKFKAVKIGDTWFTTKPAVLAYIQEQKDDHENFLEKLSLAERSLL